MPIISHWALAHLPTSAVLLAALANPALARDSEIHVQLRSGRRLSGLVDERSDEALLWLRTERKSSFLRRPVAWTQITSMHRDGEPITKEAALALATLPTTLGQPRPRVPTASAQPADYRQDLLLDGAPRSLAIRAEVGNWDRDHAPDGLLLWLQPQNEHGAVISIAGLVEAECWGLERRHGKPGGELTLIERWSQPVTPADFAANSALLKLPYGSTDPSEQLEFNPQGLVRVRLSIPGEGTLEAMLDGIRLRPATPVRDWQRVGDLFPR
jgi:hypothetical protein